MGLPADLDGAILCALAGRPGPVRTLTVTAAVLGITNDEARRAPELATISSRLYALRHAGAVVHDYDTRLRCVYRLAPALRMV